MLTCLATVKQKLHLVASPNPKPKSPFGYTVQPIASRYTDWATWLNWTYTQGNSLLLQPERFERFSLFNPGRKLVANSFYCIKLTLNNFVTDSHFPNLLWSRVLADKWGPSNYWCTLHKPSLESAAFHVRKYIKSPRNFTSEQTVYVLNRFSMASFLHKNIGASTHS
jgi:hypothetical protein